MRTITWNWKLILLAVAVLSAAAFGIGEQKAHAAATNITLTKAVSTTDTETKITINYDGTAGFLKYELWKGEAGDKPEQISEYYRYNGRLDAAVGKSAPFTIPFPHINRHDKISTTKKDLVAGDIYTILVTEILGGANATLTFNAGIDKPLLSVAASKASINEGQTATFVLTIENPSKTITHRLDKNLIVDQCDINKANCGSTKTSEPGNWTGPGNLGEKNLILTANQKRINYSIATIDDNIAEVNGYLGMEIAPNAAYKIKDGQARAVIQIIDDDAIAPTVSWETTGMKAPVEERDEGNSGTTSFSHKIVLSEATTQNITVNLQLDTTNPPATATRTTDYAAGKLTPYFWKNSGDGVIFNRTPGIDVPHGTTEVEVVLAGVVGDKTVESDEITIFNVVNGNGYTVGMYPKLTMIIDDDDAIIVWLEAKNNTTMVTEGTSFTIVANIDPQQTADVTVPLAYANNGAETTDYTKITTITIPANSSTGEGTIATNHDIDIDNDKFVVKIDANSAGELSGQTNNIRTGAFTMNASHPAMLDLEILDDDSPTVDLSVSAASTYEGHGFTVFATRSHAQSNAVAIPVMIVKGTAETDDITGGVAQREIVIPENATEGSITINTKRDNDDIDDETFMVKLPDQNNAIWPSGYNHGTKTVVDLKITDTTQVKASLSSQSNTIKESEGTLDISVEINTVLNKDINIPLTVEGVKDDASTITGHKSDITVVQNTQKVTYTITVPEDDNFIGGSFSIQIDLTKLDDELKDNIIPGDRTALNLQLNDDFRPVMPPTNCPDGQVPAGPYSDSGCAAPTPTPLPTATPDAFFRGTDPNTGRQTVQWDLVTQENPQFGSLPKFAAWAILSAMFLWVMLRQMTMVPPYIAALGTFGFMTVMGVIFQMHILTTVMVGFISVGMSYFVYTLRR